MQLWINGVSVTCSQNLLFKTASVQMQLSHEEWTLFERLFKKQARSLGRIVNKLWPLKNQQDH